MDLKKKGICMLPKKQTKKQDLSQPVTAKSSGRARPSSPRACHLLTTTQICPERATYRRYDPAISLLPVGRGRRDGRGRREEVLGD